MKPEIRVILPVHDTAHSLPAATRNSAMRESRGEIIATIDADDRIHSAIELRTLGPGRVGTRS